MLLKAVSSLIAIAAVLVLSAAVYLLFHGYFDHGKFEVLAARWNASHQVALLGKRSDHQALSSDQLLVAIADHILTPRELRHSYYYQDHLAFRSSGSCVDAQWRSQKTLVIGSCAEAIPAGNIALQKNHLDDVSVTYVNIPAMATAR